MYVFKSKFKCKVRLTRQSFICIINCMVKTTPPAKPRPTKHCFFLKSIEDNPDLYHKKDVLVKFTPLRKRKSVRHTSITPKFNHDRKFYTTSFMLPSIEFEDDAVLVQHHQKLVAQAQREITELMYPKPSSKHKFCSVCKFYYEDYKEHVESEDHHTYSRESQYQPMINDVATRLQQQRQKELEKGEMSKGKEEDEKTMEAASEEAIIKCLNQNSSVSELGYISRFQEEALISF